MSTIGQGISKPGLILAGMMYFAMLSVALVGLHVGPEIVLALSVGGIGLLFLSMRPYVGVHILIVTLFMEYSLGSGAGVTPMKVIGGGVLGGWIVNMGLQRRTGLTFDRFFLLLALYLAWCGVSLAFALDTSAAMSRLFTYTQLALATLMLSSVVDTLERMRRVYWSIVLGVTASAILAMGMYYVGMTANASGLVGNRNLLAVYINIAIVCAYLLHQETRNGARRVVLMACLPILFLCLALTFSRMGLIVLLATLILVWYRAARKRQFLLLVGTVGMLCILTFILPAAFWKRAESIVPAIRKQQDTFGARMHLWRVALKMVEDRPVVGVGPGNYVAAFPRYASGGDQYLQNLPTHNTYLSLAAETGVIGLSLFLGISGLSMLGARRAALAGRTLGRADLEIFGVVAEVCLLAVLMGAISGNYEDQKMLWVLFGLAVAMRRMTERLTIPERSTAVPIDPGLPVERLNPWLPAQTRQ